MTRMEKRIDKAIAASRREAIASVKPPPRPTMMRYLVTQSCTRLPPAYPLIMMYPYSAAVDETNITIRFRDFPDEVGTGSTYEPISTVAHRTLASILEKLYHSHTIITMPSDASDGEELAQVPEYTALGILRRNWELAKVVAEARSRFNEIYRNLKKNKLEVAHDPSQTQTV